MKRSEKLRAIQDEIGNLYQDMEYFKTEHKLAEKRLKKLQRKEIKLQQID